MKSDRTALIVGVNGMIGRAAALEFVKAGYRVTGVSRGYGEYANADALKAALPGAEIILADMALEETAQRLCTGADVIVFAGGVSGVVESFEDPVSSLIGNGVPWLRTLQCARKGARVLLVSSQLVYGPANRRPFKEDDTCQPRSPYALHRLLMEEQGRLLAGRRGLGVIALRLGNVYGEVIDLDAPRSHGLLARMLRDLVRDGRIRLYGGGQQIVDLVHAEDLASALTLVTQRGPGFEVFNVSGHRVTVREIAEALQAGVGGGVLVDSPWPPGTQGTTANDIVMDDSAFRDAFQWRPLRPTMEVIQHVASCFARMYVAVR